MPRTDGVYYAHADYAGFWRRIIIDLIDFAVAVTLALIVSAAVATWVTTDHDAIPRIVFWAMLGVGFLYLIVLKRTNVRTLGYRLAGVRVVDLHGARPSLWALSVRTGFIVAGPLGALVDLLWLTGDRHRQALRDKFAHTYVVRQRAVPAGHGTIAHSTYTILGYGFLFPEVREPR